ncbi:MAG: hypothetical protein WCO84_04615 [bacterium]
MILEKTKPTSYLSLFKISIFLIIFFGFFDSFFYSYAADNNIPSSTTEIVSGLYIKWQLPRFASSEKIIKYEYCTEDNVVAFEVGVSEATCVLGSKLIEVVMEGDREVSRTRIGQMYADAKHTIPYNVPSSPSVTKNSESNSNKCNRPQNDSLTYSFDFDTDTMTGGTNKGLITDKGNGIFVASCTKKRCNPQMTCTGTISGGIAKLSCDSGGFTLTIPTNTLIKASGNDLLKYVSYANMPSASCPIFSSDNILEVKINTNKKEKEGGVYVIPCEEARSFFTDKDFEKNKYNLNGQGEIKLLKKNESEITEAFVSAIEKYNSEHPDAHAYMSESPSGNLHAMFWLMTQGSAEGPSFVFNKTVDEVAKKIQEIATQAKEFKKRNPKDYDTFKMYKEMQNQMRDLQNSSMSGTEPALQKAIINKAKQTDNKLAPGDVFGLALEQVGGDARQALLLAHNTLRSSARAGDDIYTGVSPTPSLFTDSLIELNGHGPESNAGTWYHLFTTAFGDVQMQGDAGPLAAAGTAGNVLAETADSIRKLKMPGFDLSPGEQSNLSGFANTFEQIVRTGSFDPEKYCVNVWGARIGQRLYQSLAKPADPIYGPTGARSPDMLDARQAKELGSNEYDPGVLARGWRSASGVASKISSLPYKAISKVAEGVVSVENSFSVDSGGNTIESVGSPVNITWEGPSGKMVLDQETQSLYGYYPVFIVPVYEKETDTWGATWLNLTKEKHSLVFDAVATGTLHYAIADQSTGKVATYIAPVATGDHLEIPVSSSDAPSELIGPNGKKIAPVVVAFAEPVVLSTVQSQSPITVDTPSKTKGLRYWIFAILVIVFIGISYKKYPEKTVAVLKKILEITKIVLIKLFELFKLVAINLFYFLRIITSKIIEIIKNLIVKK